MNTAAPYLPVMSRARETTAAPAVRTSNKVVCCLLAAVLISAFAVIYVKDLNRRLFIQYQTAQTTYNQLYVEWNKLLLEQSTWATQSRIQRIAQQRLGMELLTPRNVVMIRV